MFLVLLPPLHIIFLLRNVHLFILPGIASYPTCLPPPPPCPPVVKPPRRLPLLGTYRAVSVACRNLSGL
eukprot:4576599-Pyramimonas_sp.AAC.1